MPRLREALLSAECLLGAAISDQISRHHRRRLRRIGWEHALEANGSTWAAGEPPPRPGNAIEVLIDGAEALPLIASELSSARSHIHMTNWFLSPDFDLVRGEQPVALRHLLAELAERVDVRVLVWGGAPLPLFRPSRREVREMRDRLTQGTRIRCGLDTKERPMHCHHEKTIVIDDRVAFVGGIDLTYQSGDRFDSAQHPARSSLGWHDTTARIEGPAVTDVAEHFRMPVQVPLAAVRATPSCAVPVRLGATVLTGGLARMTALAGEAAGAVPSPLVAVTIARTCLPALPAGGV